MQALQSFQVNFLFAVSFFLFQFWERETVKEKEQEQKGVRELPLQLPVSTNDQLVSSYEKINQFLTTVLFLLWPFISRIFNFFQLLLHFFF